MMQTVALYNGIKMPILSLGVYPVPDAAQCEQAVLDAFTAGYRLVDTAEGYMNEEAVGSAFKKSGLKREEVFSSQRFGLPILAMKEPKRRLKKR